MTWPLVGAYFGIAFFFLYVLGLVVGTIMADDKEHTIEHQILNAKPANFSFIKDRFDVEDIGGFWWMIGLGSLLWPLTTVIGTIIAVVWSISLVVNIPVTRRVKKVVYKHRALIITSPVEHIRELGNKYLKGRKDA